MTEYKFFEEDNMITMARYPDKYFDWLIADPPYFSGPEKRAYYGNEISGHGVKRIDYPVIDEWTPPGPEYFKEAVRISKNQLIWGINYYDVILGSGRLIWDKVNYDNTFSDCEIAYVSSHDSVRLYRYMWNGMMQGKSMREGHIMQGNKKLNQKKLHQTEKPVILYDWIFKTYCKPGDKVYESHGGSFSIALSALKYRDLAELVVSELDPTHFKNGTKRFYRMASQHILI